jgi:hypothetical protein
MLILAFTDWWYKAGWRDRARLVSERLDKTLDYFSISLLLKTFFAPFRQISAGKVNGPLGVKFRAFVDRLISRVIGAMIRSFILVIGLFVIAFQALAGLLVLLLWQTIPLVPVVGLAMFLIGWVPA